MAESISTPSLLSFRQHGVSTTTTTSPSSASFTSFHRRIATTSSSSRRGISSHRLDQASSQLHSWSSRTRPERVGLDVSQNGDAGGTNREDRTQMGQYSQTERQLILHRQSHVGESKRLYATPGIRFAVPLGELQESRSGRIHYAFEIADCRTNEERTADC